jgi:hypothetical protein
MPTTDGAIRYTIYRNLPESHVSKIAKEQLSG